MTGYDKIKKFVSEVHEINCALTDEIIEFIDEVIEQEQVGNVAKPNACPQLYEVRADVRELLKSIDEYHEAFSVSELEHFSRQKLDAGVKMMRLKNKVSEHFV